MGVGAPTAAAADEIPATSAKSPANIEKALGFFDQLNRDVREKARSKALTEQQIADANAAKGIKVEEVQEGTGSSAALPALKVNSDTMAWAQTRADELAERAVELTSLESPINHDNNKNGMPSRAGTVDADGDVVSSLLDHPDQQTGTYIFGPENLAAGYPSVDPVTGWTSELQTGEQGYAHYLAEISPFANVAGFAVAKVTSGTYEGWEIAVLEIAYDSGEAGHGTNMTVEQAKKTLLSGTDRGTDPGANPGTDPGEEPAPGSDECEILFIGTVSGVEVETGAALNLPTHVTVGFRENNGVSQEQVPVTWGALTEAQRAILASEGEFSLQGQVGETGKTVTLTVVVKRPADNGGSDNGGTEQPGNGGTDKPQQPGGNTDNGSAPAGEQGTNKPADKAAGGKKATKVVKGKSLAKTGVDALGLGVAVIALAGLGGAAAVTARKRAH